MAARWQDPTWQSAMTLHYDYNNMMESHLGREHGLNPQLLVEMAPEMSRIIERIHQKHKEGDMGFMSLVRQDALVSELQRIPDEIRGKYDDYILLGIGGSALGPIALQTALHPKYYNELSAEERHGLPRLHVMDNVDPSKFAEVLSRIHPERTLVNVVTKSGSTAETMAAFLIFKKKLEDALGKEKAKSHIWVTTDPEKGDLRKIATAEGYRTFAIPENVGGRFSVLTPVGLVPAAVLGMDVAELLAGAEYMVEICRNTNIHENPAALFAATQYLASKQGKNISIMMPYSDRLKDVADWYRQLWAESLGKKMSLDGEVVNVGQTPVNALGVTDQHSQVQLYAEGPYDKVINFLHVLKLPQDVAIPTDLTSYSSTGYLGGHTMAELLDIEYRGTAHALTSAGRANATFQIPEVNAFTVGQMFYLLEMATAISGDLYNIDAFDQPGVEAGKVAAYALMGRKGYERKREEIQRQSAPDEMYVM